MANKRISIPKARVKSMLSYGHSMQRIADSFGVSRGVVKRRLIEWGLAVPTQSDSHRGRLRRMTKKERAKLTANARKARTKALTPAAQHAKALTRQQTKSSATPESLQLAELLVDFAPVPEFAIGKYNVDIAIPKLKVAIELDGGGWHAGNATRRRDIGKERLLQSKGWIILRYVDAADRDQIRTALHRISPVPIMV